MRLWLLLASASVWAQPVLTDVFPPEEYAARRARVFDKIGDGVAILLGTGERPGEQPLRQNNQFFYLCGALEPRAILVLDGRTRRTTVFLKPYNERREKSMFGPGLSPGDAAAKALGAGAVLARDEFSAAVAEFARSKRRIFTPFRPEVLGSASAHDVVSLALANRTDPWDGRGSREDAFIAKLKAVAPDAEITDLDPILDGLRAVKSPREIAIIREATRITGLAAIEAMRAARPGMVEYELQAPAEYIFKKHGAYGPAYFALIATGTNTYYSHYHKSTATLRDGELLQWDYAPDYKYYTSDISRVFPVNGRFTARQRELYTVYLRLYQALLTSIRVHATPEEIATAAARKMDAILAAFPFTDPAIREAASKLAAQYRDRRVTNLGHTIGMEVHDPPIPTATLEPGNVFTIEPALRMEGERTGIRLEDVILITETGYENLSAFVPIEIADIEKAMAQGRTEPSGVPLRGGL